METIKNFLAKYNNVTHGIAAVIAFCVGAYFNYPPFHDFVLNTYAILPGWVKQIATGLWLLYTLYRQGAAKWQPGDPNRRNNLLSKGGQP